jgi:hypothetical protein
VAQLAALGLETAALEQKCLQQVANVALPEVWLRQQIGLWEEAIDRSMDRLREINLEIIEKRRIGEFR